MKFLVVQLFICGYLLVGTAVAVVVSATRWFGYFSTDPEPGDVVLVTIMWPVILAAGLVRAACLLVAFCVVRGFKLWIAVVERCIRVLNPTFEWHRRVSR